VVTLSEADPGSQPGIVPDSLMRGVNARLRRVPGASQRHTAMRAR
jgi:hypothetical protein